MARTLRRSRQRSACWKKNGGVHEGVVQKKNWTRRQILTRTRAVLTLPHTISAPHALHYTATYSSILSIIQVTMPTTYLCQCSRCHGKSKRLTKRTIEAHLKHDQMYLTSISSTNADLSQFMQSCIDQTITLLAMIHGGRGLLDMASDAGGSHLEGSEGA